MESLPKGRVSDLDALYASVEGAELGHHASRIKRSALGITGFTGSFTLRSTC